MSKKKDKTATRKETKPLPCQLTEKEIGTCGREAARAYSAHVRIEGELKSVKSEYKAKLDEQKALIAKFSGRVESGTETRDVECIEVKNWTEATVIVTRSDTKEKIEDRPMREDEKQTELFDQKPLAKKKGKSETEAAKLEPQDTYKPQPVTDEHIEKALEIIHDTKRASITALKRRMDVSMTLASRIMDVLEERNIVGPARGSQPREILVEKTEA